MSGTRGEPRVFFSWEKRRGFSVLGRGRARQVLFVGAALAVFLGLRAREHRASDVRATRAAITSTMNAISAFRADHDRSCPSALSDLVAAGYLHAVPRDAWGHALRVTCPGRRDPGGFDVSSDGPDGELGGVDRIE